MPEEFSLKQTRNIGIIAHIDAGKTTVTERILYYTGKKHKVGEVHEGQAEMDWMEQERERGVTITAAATTVFWKPPETEKIKINIIDTPGHIDFTAEVQRSLRVLDGGVVVFDGVAGVEPQSETVWHQAEKFNVPLLAFVNKLDRTGADFYADLDSIHERLTKHAYPIQLPIGEEANFKGIIDLLHRKANVYLDDMGDDIDEQDIPQELEQKVEEYRSKLIEAIVSHDDTLMTQYLEDKELDVNELKRVLRNATIEGKIIPVLCGSALKNKGVQLLLDAICAYLPSPLDVPPVEGFLLGDDKKEVRKPDPDEPFAALAFKVATDPYVGRLCYFRVYSGTLSAGSYILNVTTNNKERVGRIVRMHANKREEVKSISAGDIAAIVGIKNTTTGDTLCDPHHPIILESITFPEPVISVAIEPKTKADQEKMGLAISKLTEEDPTFKVKTDEETGQTIISGMGELHLEIIVDRLKREFKVEASVGKPQVAYKETITKIAEIEGKYIHQSGGRGQYGHCWLRLEPQEHGKGFEFVNEIKGGVIPREFIPAIKKGVVEAMSNGVLAGYPLIDMLVAVYDGTFHEVDSSEAAFKIAAARAIREGTKNANPVLLEPIMKIEVVAPEKFLGDVVGDLNARRARIKQTKSRGQVKLIDATVPLAEMFGYTTSLRSMTEGRGSSTMEFSHYAQVPKNIQEQITEDETK
ncbi:elongation factor G [Patescibacteria group bacterium AH-259-L05]|nr:elongation factor G [Patescibacteria group bacterium AH-259-L05]